MKKLVKQPRKNLVKVGSRLVSPDKIIRIETESWVNRKYSKKARPGSGNITHVYILGESQSRRVSKTIKRWELLLTDEGFISPHQSHLVNTKFIKMLEEYQGLSMIVEGIDGKDVIIPISAQKTSEIWEIFNVKE